MFYGAGAVTHENEKACIALQEARQLRQKYFGGNSTSWEDLDSTESNLVFQMGNDGIMELYKDTDTDRHQSLCRVPSIDDFSEDYGKLVEVVNHGSTRSFAFQRLQILSSAFRMHVTMNGAVEATEQSNLLGTDFYRTLKVDNHIHAAAAPTARQFVGFVTKKLETEPHATVSPDGKTLSQVFEEAGIDKDHLTIDAFSVLADYSVYQRFDNFNAKYSPFRMADMRRIFLKTTNHMDGRYFAELMKLGKFFVVGFLGGVKTGMFLTFSLCLVLSRHEIGKGHNSACEMRLSIYGMERHEWKDLAIWMLKDWTGGEWPGPVLSDSNRWLIQIPRLWRIYCTKPGCSNRSFLEMLENIFVPMFEATLYPEEHPEISEALKHIVGIDSVDDEGSAEETCYKERPQDWTSSKNPAYWWQLYYLWGNLEVLNSLRRARGLNIFAFRPHAGETGDPMHLAATYLLCESINHGINLDMQVSLQYLYYLDQVGMSISPLSNNFLFRKMAENPFAKFFRKLGRRVLKSLKRDVVGVVRIFCSLLLGSLKSLACFSATTGSFASTYPAPKVVD